MLPSKIISDIKPCNLINLYLIGICANSFIKLQPGGYIILKDVRLACMIMPNTDTCWFESVQVTLFDLDEVTARNK